MALIEREALIKAIERDSPEQVTYTKKDAVECVLCMPTIDAATVVHGRWICDNSDSLYQYHCSVCKKQGRSRFDSYCPNCGCKMDGGEGHEN